MSAGADVHEGFIDAGFDRLYKVVELPSVQEHTLTVQVSPGVSVYDFTFGRGARGRLSASARSR